jgi:hypothetical protein
MPAKASGGMNCKVPVDDDCGDDDYDMMIMT